MTETKESERLDARLELDGFLVEFSDVIAETRLTLLGNPREILSSMLA